MRQHCKQSRLHSVWTMAADPVFWYGFSIGFLVASILALVRGLVAGRRR